MPWWNKKTKRQEWQLLLPELSANGHRLKHPNVHLAHRGCQCRGRGGQRQELAHKQRAPKGVIPRGLSAFLDPTRDESRAALIADNLSPLRRTLGPVDPVDDDL